MNKAITQAALHPIAENFSWSQAREVFTRMEQASHFGKLVLTVE
jgi:hypothetical protein